MTDWLNLNFIDDPDTIQTQHDMAAVRANQQKYDLAVKLFEEVYAKRRAVLGKNHPVRLHCILYNI